MLLEFLEICFEDIRPAWQKPEKFGPLTAKCSAIIVSMQSKISILMQGLDFDS